MNGKALSEAVPVFVTNTAPESATIEQKSVSSPAYETKQWPYLLTMPAYWLLTFWVMTKKLVYRLLGRPNPSINTLWFDGLGKKNRQIKDGAGSWRALDLTYNHQFGQYQTIGNWIDDFWIGNINAQAVRNRLRLVKQELEIAIDEISQNQSEVRILSLACGSAQGVIEVMARKRANGLNIKTLLLDVEEDALSYAKQIAKDHGINGQIQTIRSNVARVAKVAKKFKPHIIEMVGLLDYISQDKAVKLLTKIREALPSQGIFLTCNIRPNRERHFLRWVINWEMIYRTPAELEEVISQAGFTNYQLVYEPLQIHGLVVARKDD